MRGYLQLHGINKSINDEIRIKKNKILLKEYEYKVEMDSREFEKYFDVYAKSNIVAMEILTHDIMEELISFYQKYETNFEILIKNNNVYIRFDTGAMFEPNILKKAHDIDTLWIYYSVLQFVTNVTTKINKLLKEIEI